MAGTSGAPRRGEVLHLPRAWAAPPVLLRIPVTSATWAESLPPMPAGAGITVAFSDPEVEAEHEDALALLGYRGVGVFPSRQPIDPAIDMLIPRSAADRWPRWRDEVLCAGGRVWDLAFGPVAAVMAPAVAVHAPEG